MKDTSFAMTVREIKSALNCATSCLEVILSRSHFAKFETTVKIITSAGKLRNSRAYCITPEFVDVLLNDLEKSQIFKRKGRRRYEDRCED